jgi:hypothetical protein|tara:strand:- start:321 stop:569 length:249 start_codon:yes stop_codon:yes gene_type:complete
MKELDKLKVHEELESLKKNSDFVIDSRVFKAEKYFEVSLNNIESFMSLIWQDMPASKKLTPPGQPRTPLDVSKRFIDDNLTF